MSRRFKVLGLALIAVCAMSAAVASVAIAHTPAAFHVEKVPATITANQKTTHTLVITGQTLICEVVVLEGTVNELTPTLVNLAVRYEKCPWGGFNATITNFAIDDSEIGQKGKCWYQFTATGLAALECNQADVTMDAGPCVVHIPAQSLGAGVAYSTETTVAGKHDLTANFSFNKVTATHTDGFLCPFGSSGHSGEAAFHGTSTMIAEAEFSSELLHLTHSPTVP